MASKGHRTCEAPAAEFAPAYERDGLIKFTLSNALLSLREQLRSEMTEWLRHFAPQAGVQAESLSGDLVSLAKSDRPLIGSLYKVARRFPSVKRIASHDDLLSLACAAMATRMASCCNFVSLRIDLPGEEKYLVQPHQDFPYIQGSLNGVTIWIPLEDCPLDLGPPSWIPTSQQWGVLPVREYSLDEAGQVGANIFELQEPQCLAGHGFEQTPLDYREALLFHTLLVHRSEANRSTRARVSLQIRFDDLFNQASFRRDYPEGRYLDNRLTSSYPEYCSQKGSSDEHV